jgi:4a-hydroxytetrahydrobiopterin dehydratase
MTQVLQDSAIAERLQKIPNWVQEGKEIVRNYKFPSFREAIAFVNRVADEADKMDHHPDILIQYNKVRLSLSTHSAGGLTDKDFTLAERVGQ